MLNVFFGYSSEYEYHGPLELILGYIHFRELESKFVYICKDFYLASKYSYLDRKIEYKEIRRLLYKVDKSFDDFMIRLYQYKCVRFDNDELFNKCAANGLIKIIKTLLVNEKDKINPSYENNYAIRYASMNGYIDIVELLLSDSKVDPSDFDNFAIRKACENGHLNVVILLLSDPRIDPSSSENFGIILASENGHYSIVRLLLSDSRVDPSDNHNLAIRKASSNGHIDVVKLLMSDSRVDPSDQDNEAIRWAGLYNRHKVVELLMTDPRVMKYYSRIN